MSKNILDELMIENVSKELIEPDKMIIPEMCFKCETSAVCSIVPSFAALSKLGILINVDICPYHKPEVDDENIDDQ